MLLKTKTKGIFFLMGVASFYFFLSTFANAQNIPPGQDVGAREREIEQTKRLKEKEKDLVEGKKKAEVKEKGILKESPRESGAPETRALIAKIEVEGVTLLKESQVRSIVSPYEGRELSLEGFREVADAITQEYRKRGYATSFAVIPPQKVENNTLKIQVAEGRVGKVSISGNKHFRTGRLKKYLGMKEGTLLNYDEFRRNLNWINEHPDRNARAVLERGEGPYETDINIDVQDRLPWHVSFGYNNYNSRFLERNKYLMELKNNNFLGFDDVLSGEVQLGEAGRFQLYGARYAFPISDRAKVGINYVHINQKLGRALSGFDIQGKGDIITPYYSYHLIDGENFDLNTIFSFDYKEIENKTLGTIVGKDDLRILKLGFDLDYLDRFHGRSILTQEFHVGLPGFMGGLDRNDPGASRSGADAGGDFFRFVTNVGRLQSLPYDLSLMIKGSMQVTTTDVVSTEQFTIGGFYSVRGYDVGEFAGDQGFSLSSEFYIPPYFIPKDVKVPFTSSTFYNSLRFLGFFDWALIHNRTPLSGESETENLFGIGPALRFTVSNRLSVSFDYGIAVGREPSAGKRAQPYIEVKLFF